MITRFLWTIWTPWNVQCPKKADQHNHSHSISAILPWLHCISYGVNHSFALSYWYKMPVCCCSPWEFTHLKKMTCWSSWNTSWIIKTQSKLEHSVHFVSVLMATNHADICYYNLGLNTNEYATNKYQYSMGNHPKCDHFHAPHMNYKCVLCNGI